MNIEVPVVRIALHSHTIPIPFGMGVLEAWERVQNYRETGEPPWPEDTLIKGVVTVVAHPNGRIMAVQFS